MTAAGDMGKFSPESGSREDESEAPDEHYVLSVSEDSDEEEPQTTIDPIDEFLKPLEVNESRLYKLAQSFSPVFKHLALTSQEQFLPTPVTRLPTGNELGRYLAIDVGGSNLRVAFVELLGEEEPDADPTPINATERTFRRAQRQRVKRTMEKSWPIQDHLKKDNADDLFSWIGDCIAEVIADSLSSDATKGTIPPELEMGITFSFPIMQESVTEATLMPMGKGFAISSNLDLKNMLLLGYERHTRRASDDSEPSSKRRKLYALPKLKIAAITNDTVATIISSAYRVKSLPNSRVAMGIIVGTGCNATIPMKLSDLHESKRKLVSARDPNATETIVNTEWTISGAAGPLRDHGIITKWDAALDRACARPGFQPLEYMTGGRYLGELVRIIFYDYLTSVVGLDRRHLPAALVQEYALGTAYLAKTVARITRDEELVEELKRSLPPPESTDWNWDVSTARAFRKVSRAVETRAAGLIAAATVGLLASTGEIQLRDDTDPRPQPTMVGSDAIAPPRTEAEGLKSPRNHIVPILSPTTPDWKSGPEELVVAYTGGVIQNYPQFKHMCQAYIDRLIIRNGPQKGGKSVFLREASDGGVIGAGVLAAMVAGSRKDED